MDTQAESKCENKLVFAPGPTEAVMWFLADHTHPELSLKKHLGEGGVKGVTVGTGTLKFC